MWREAGADGFSQCIEDPGAHGGRAGISGRAGSGSGDRRSGGGGVVGQQLGPADAAAELCDWRRQQWAAAVTGVLRAGDPVLPGGRRGPGGHGERFLHWPRHARHHRWGPELGWLRRPAVNLHGHRRLLRLCVGLLGGRRGFADEPHVARSADGGRSWADVSPPDWATALWWPNAIDCVSARTCYVAGTDNSTGLQNPAAAKTTDGGATWTVFTNLPTFTSSDPNGTYVLNGISCVSARSCVAVGGLNEADGTATVISTTDGGSTWSRSADPSLANVQQFFSVSCLAGDDGPPACTGAGSALSAAGPVTLESRDGGATWGGMQTLDNTGWLNSISYATLRHCWAAGAGTSVSLAGTSNGGRSWSTVTSDTTNQDGSVSCLSIRVCVATTDNGLWVTSNDGGLPPSD